MTNKVALIGNKGFSLVNFRRELMQAFMDRGFDVIAMAPIWSDEEQTQLKSFGIKPREISLEITGMNMIRDAADIGKLVQGLRTINPDMLLCYNTKPVIYGSIAGRLAQVPRIFALITGAGYAFSEQPGLLTRQAALKFMLKKFYTISLKFVDEVIFQNQHDKNFFVEHNLTDQSKTHVVNGSGVNLEEFDYTEPSVEPVHFLIMARLIEEKGIRTFVRAARIVKKKFPRTEFTVLGSLYDSPSALAETELQSWVDEGLIDWPGHVENVKAYLDNSSVFVLPSYYREGIPRSILEAMAKGRPVITTDNPGCRDTVIDGENGFLVPVKDVSTLAEGMKRFIREPELIDKMGSRSRELAQTKFDVNKVNSRMLRIMGIE